MRPASTGGLFLDPVPEPPGDPAELTRAAATYAAAHGELDRGHAMLGGVAGQTGPAGWAGAGAAAFSSATTDLAGAYSLTSAALARGAAALRGYAADLTTAKHLTTAANAAVTRVNATASALLDAQSAAQRAQASADGTASASATADAQAAASPHSPAAQAAASDARWANAQAQDAASTAWALVATLTAQHDAEYTRAATLCAQAETTAAQAAVRAAAGFEAATAALGGHSGHHSAQSVWSRVIHSIPVINDHAGWVLNAWGLFGAYVLGKAEFGFLRAESALSSANATEIGAWNAIIEGRAGFFSSGLYQAQGAYTLAAQQAQDATKGLQNAIRPAVDDSSLMGMLGKVGLGAGMASDVVTFAAPAKSFGPDHLLGGNTDRAMAAANFAASGLALGDSLGFGMAATAMAIPGVDVVVGGVLVGTALYSGGEFVYSHWGTIAHGLSDAGSWLGHGFSDAGSWLGHEANGFQQDLTSAFSWL